VQARVNILAAARARRVRSGTTLVELTVVLAIMTIMAGLIVPSIRAALRGTGLRATGQRFADLVPFAGAAAVSRQRTVSLHLDLNRRLCEVTTTATRLPWLEAQDQPQAEVLARVAWPHGTHVIVTHPQPFEAEAAGRWAPDTITFRNDGSTDDARLILTDDQGGRLEIVVLGATGEVRIEEGGGS